MIVRSIRFDLFGDPMGEQSSAIDEKFTLLNADESPRETFCQVIVASFIVQQSIHPASDSLVGGQ